MSIKNVQVWRILTDFTFLKQQNIDDQKSFNFLFLLEQEQIFDRRMRKNSVSNFIQKTWDILQDPQYSNILTWSEDGNSFLVINEPLLCSQVLPKYFKHSNFSSFIRQLNMYNFHKKKRVQSTMEFYHRLFLKDKKELLIGIKRKPSEAEIQFGQQLIRKMQKEAFRSNSSQISISDENIHLNSDISQKEFQNRQILQSCHKNNIFDSPPTFYCPIWMGFCMPLFQINPEKYENNKQEIQGHKILTNIIIKTAPSECSQ